MEGGDWKAVDAATTLGTAETTVLHVYGTLVYHNGLIPDSSSADPLKKSGFSEVLTNPLQGVLPT
jgi:hypothetical protein